MSVTLTMWTTGAMDGGPTTYTLPSFIFFYIHFTTRVKIAGKTRTFQCVSCGILPIVQNKSTFRRTFMSDIRAEWIAMLQQYRLSPDRADSEQFWCTRLDTAPREELRAIQSEKLRVAVRYAY